MDDPTAEDPRATAIADQLDDTGLTPIVGQSFTDQTIYLDGRSFERCTFTRCRFRSRVGWFRIVGKTPMRDSDLTLDGPAARVVGFHDGMRASLVGDVNPIPRRGERPN